MPNNNNVTLADIVLIGLQDLSCFTSMQEVLQALPTLIAAAVPNNITNVTVSNIEPSDSQTGNVWFRISNAGSFVSINVFSQGAWHPIYPVNADLASPTLQIFWLQGDPANPPTGWTNTNDAAGVDPGIQTALAALWVTGTNFTYYSAVFTGF